MISDWKDALQKRLDENFAAFIESLQNKTVSELISMAPEITAAKQLHEELLNACNQDNAEFLLQFDNPLDVVRGHWEFEVAMYDHSVEMGDLLWEIQDKELYPKDLLTRPEKAAESLPPPAAQSKKSQQKKEKKSHER